MVDHDDGIDPFTTLSSYLDGIRVVYSSSLLSHYTLDRRSPVLDHQHRHKQ
jgi:hypothetical protein